MTKYSGYNAWGEWVEIELFDRDPNLRTLAEWQDSGLVCNGDKFRVAGGYGAQALKDSCITEVMAICSQGKNNGNFVVTKGKPWWIGVTSESLRHDVVWTRQARGVDQISRWAV